jgi:phenylalanyl-tRNA synthetase alpha subunit
VRLLAAGRVFRPEREDAGHSKVFHQLDGVCIAPGADVAAFKARMDGYIDEIKASKKARGADTIYLPGEPEHLRVQERLDPFLELLQCSEGRVHMERDAVLSIT